MRICIVATVPFALKVFMTSHIQALSADCHISLITNGVPDDLSELTKFNNVQFVYAPIYRKISPLQDIRAALSLWRYFRIAQPSVVLSLTPKAGLLTILAATLAGVPIRLHIFTGQIWVTKQGLGRRVLKAADRFIATFSTHVLADSASQREFLIGENIVAREKIRVLGQGSICGVDIERFAPDAVARRVVRQQLTIPQDAHVFLYLGRLNREKGLLELARAFTRLAAIRDDVWLVVVGPDEECMQAAIRKLCQSALDRLRFSGYTETPERFMAMADIFCLPSHREGFGSVIIEAAAVGVPCVASKIYGITDAVVDGDTGLLFISGDEESLLACMNRLVKYPQQLLDLGTSARLRALRDFSAVIVTKTFVRYIHQIHAEPRCS